MESLDLTELKKIEIELLDSFCEICEKENLRYSLGAGTLLGAVRHKGFIPWDDDIDVLMPRPDYNKFIKYCRDNCVPFKVFDNSINSDYWYVFGKISKINTIMIEENTHLNDIDLGVYIDIFPIDAMGNDYKEAVKKWNKTRVLRNIQIAKNWKKYFRSKTNSWIKEPFRLLFYIISRMVDGDKLTKKIINYYKNDFDKTEYCAYLIGDSGINELLPRSVYTEYTEVEFEGKKYKAISAYDKYLKNCYGDYMKLPSLEKQVSHHMFKAFYI